MQFKTAFLATSLSVISLMTTATYANAESWPNLPAGFKNGVAAKIDNHILVGLGTLGADLYALDLDNVAAGWEKRASFSGAAPSQPAFGTSNGALYIFGGSGKQNEADVAPIIFDSVFQYNVGNDTWTQIDAPTPVGMLGASGLSLKDGRIAVIGGYNKDLFDKYLLDVMTTDKDKEADKWNQIVNDYMGMEPKDYLWNQDVWAFNPSTGSWTDIGDNPYLANTGSGIAELSANQFMVVNGEIKPGLRTDAVKSVSIDGDNVTWSELAALIPATGEGIQDGMAAPFVGTTSSGHVLVAGGANFPGARAKAERGEWYAHEGLSKVRHDSIFLLADGAWQQIGTLPEGLAYGGSISLDEGVLLIGGEDSQGGARTEVMLVDWDGQSLTITD